MSSLPDTLVQFRSDLEEAIGRELEAGQRGRRRRRRLVAIAAAALVVGVVTASAFGTVRELIFRSGGSAYDSPVWSPDGRRIAFLHHRWDDSGAFSTEIYVVTADGSGKRNLTRELGTAFPIWSPDWRRIAFLRNPCDAVAGACRRQPTAIYVMDADGSGKRKLARGGSMRKVWTGQSERACDDGVAWSYDARRIAFVSDRDGNCEVYVVNAAGSEQRRLTRNPASDGGSAWSRDGRKIAFVRSYRDDRGPPRRQEIWIMNADGSGQRMLARGHAPVWSPDGRAIAFRSDRDGNGEVYVVNTDGTDLRRLTRDPASDGGAFWSPDGRKLFFVRFRHGNSDIYVVNVDGSGRRNLTPDARPARRARDGSPVLSPDGGRIAFVSERDGNRQIYVMNADGSGQRRLTQRGS
jgi:TolB protein